MMLVDTVKKFWEYIDSGEFDKLEEVMDINANVILPNTSEIFIGRKNYIAFNKDYPGRWYADIEKIVRANNEIVTAVKITDKKELSFYVTSFFELENGMITEITEYWGENGEAPKWRMDKGYSKRHS